MSELIDDLRDKVREAGRQAKLIAQDGINWMLMHPEETIVILSTSAVAIRSLNKLYSNVRQERVRNSYIYDRSMGMYWETKRPLTTNQRLEIETRHRNGESYGHILSSMGLLRK